MKVKQLLANSNRWTVEAKAKRYKGDELVVCSPHNPQAQQFCLLGAIEHCYPLNQRRKVKLKLSRYIYDNFASYRTWHKRNSPDIIADFNDGKTFKAVKQLTQTVNI